MEKWEIAFDKYLRISLRKTEKKMAELSGGKWEEPLIRLPYLGGTITVNHNNGAIEPEPKELLEKILIYKYLLEVQGIEGPGDDFIALFSCLVGHIIKNFFKLEVLEPLGKRFGDDLSAFAKAAESFGGFPCERRRYGISNSLFPKNPCADPNLGR